MTCCSCINYGLNVCLTLDVLLDYVRLVSYGIVGMASLRGIYKRKYSNLLYVGDVILAFGLVMNLVFSTIFKVDLYTTADIILTPPAVIWAILHYRAMLKFDSGELETKPK